MKHPRKRRATKISSETAGELQRAGSAPKRARRHELVNCASPAVSSFARSGRKFVETGRRDFPERLRCVAVSFLITTAPGSADLAQSPVRKGNPVQGARNRELVRDAIAGRVITPSSCIQFLGGRLQVPWTLTSGGRFGYLQRDCYAQLYCIPRRTRAGILDAQFGSKAYLGIKNHTPRRVLFEGLEGTRGGCILGEPTRRRPVLPVLAPPRRIAVSRLAPTRPWCV